jgi:hypothetical protein
VLEGQDLQRIAKGTASSQQLTLSFWVKSNVTGIYITRLYDSDNGRSVSAAYTINVSGTWERKVVTFPADTIGVLNNDNDASLDVLWGLAAGSAYTSGSLATSWTTYSDSIIYAGQTNLAAATNNYWQITGVQLEIGPVATSFEFKSYGKELAECQRYYLSSESSGLGSPGYEDWSGFLDSGYTGNCFVNYRFPVEMRIPPAITIFSGSGNGYADSHGRGQVGAGLMIADGISRRGFQQVRRSDTASLGSAGQCLRGGFRANAEL